MMAAQRSLHNVYESVRFNNPKLADEMQGDISIVAMYALAADKSPAHESVERLQRVALDLPPIQSRVLNGALKDLGY